MFDNYDHNIPILDKYNLFSLFENVMYLLFFSNSTNFDLSSPSLGNYRIYSNCFIAKHNMICPFPEKILSSLHFSP